MNGVKQAAARLLRSPQTARFLERFGIEPGKYWLLVDLFAQLSDRGEVLDQLGREGMALKTAAWLYFAGSALFTPIFVMSRPEPAAYSAVFLFFTTLLLGSVLMLETANSLMNPVEGSVLAHQPLGGATYTAAKLTHLLRIVLYLVPGLNAVPAFGGLALEGAGWWFPAVHLLIALTAGLLAALLCCAAFGWLIRYVPPQRLKATAQIVAGLPFFAFISAPHIRRWVAGSGISDWLPQQTVFQWTLGALFAGVALGVCVLGLRALSADYMIRVTSIGRGGSTAGARAKRSRLAELVARYFGGQPGRAGYSFASRMMLRDWQFRRQLIPLAPLLLVMLPLAIKGWRNDPFSGTFTSMHVIPHTFGMLLFFFCNFLAYGNDYKGAWLFLLAPAKAFEGFARGVYGALWLPVVVLPHIVMFPWLFWSWGIWHAALFTAYSAAVASAFLAVELRLIEGAPFSRQADASRGAVSLGIMIGGGIVIGIVVGLQHFLIFRSPLVVMLVTAGLGIAAYFVTRSSLQAYEVSIRYHLGLLSAETGTLYKEVNA